jgi:hypothetical protein
VPYVEGFVDLFASLRSGVGGLAVDVLPRSMEDFLNVLPRSMEDFLDLPCTKDFVGCLAE